jgi:hypothetical protein
MKYCAMHNNVRTDLEVQRMNISFSVRGARQSPVLELIFSIETDHGKLKRKGPSAVYETIRSAKLSPIIEQRNVRTLFQIARTNIIKEEENPPTKFPGTKSNVVHQKLRWTIAT